jgi:methionyl-tRNA formyltransferase
VLLVGLGPTTGHALESLMGSFDVVGLVRDVEDEVTQRALAAGIPVQVETSPRHVSELVAGLGPDCVVVSSYHRILPSGVLELCPFVNVHYSPLPAYRGRANVNWAIINRESLAAVTVHSISAGLDAGGVLAQERIPIGARDTVGSLYERLNVIQAEILPGAVSRRLGGDLGDPQQEDAATYCCTRVQEDGEIDWRASTEDVDALVRSLGPPYPHAFTYLGLDRVEVEEAGPSPEGRVYVGRVPGRVVSWSAQEGWCDVLTGDGVLRVSRVRVKGVPHDAAAVWGSSHVTLGLRTADLLRRIEVLEARIADLTTRLSSG